MRKRNIIIIAGAAAVVFLFVCIFRADFFANIYNSISGWLDKKSGIDPYWPELRTNKDLLLNGYLGIFFRFDKFGYLNWLVIPLVAYFLITLKKRERWEIAVFLALFLSCIFISFMAYGWHRYQLTIFPLLITAIFLLGWQVLRDINSKVLFTGLILIFVCLFLANYYNLRDNYAYYWKMSTGDRNHGEQFPYKLIDYVNKYVDKDSVIMEYESPILLYHANSRKNHHGGGKDEHISARSVKITGSYDLVYEDQKYKLYKKEDKIDQLYKEYYESVFSGKNLLDNGSFEQWQIGKNALPVSWSIYGSGSIQKENEDVKVGALAVKITGDNFNFYQNLSCAGLQGETKISCFAWIKSSISNKYRIQIADGIDSSFSERHPGDGSWQMLRAIHRISPQATSIEVRIVQAEKTGGLNDVVYVDGVLLFSGEYFSPFTLLREQNRQ